MLSCLLAKLCKLFVTGRSTPKSLEGLLDGSDDDGRSSPEHVAELAESNGFAPFCQGL